MSNALRHHCLLTVSELCSIRCIVFPPSSHRAFHGNDLCHLVSAFITESTIELLGSLFRASLTSLVDSQHLTCLSHFSAPDVRARVRRVVELIKITDVACWTEHHQLLKVLIILSQLCYDSNRNVRLSVFSCNCERLRSRWSQMVTECVGRPTSCCRHATDTLVSCALIR